MTGILYLVNFLPCFFNGVYFTIFHTLHSFCKLPVKRIQNIFSADSGNSFC